MKKIEEYISKHVNNSTKNFKDEMFNKTMYYQKQYGFKYNENDKNHATWNNEADAFKHTFMQAIGSLRYGNIKTIAGGWWHEHESKDIQPKGEENMDTWNNRVGREIADEVRKIKGNFGTKLTSKQTEDIVAAKIMERMKKGDLITHPSDKRDYKKDYENYMKRNRTTGLAANIPDIGNEDFRNTMYFSREDVGKMTTKEFSEMEDIINRQLKDGTMQNKDYFNSKVKNGDMIWVDGYERSDGTKVSGYYRSK